MDIQDYQYIKRYCGSKTRVQDKYPFDSFLIGINGLYHTIGDDSYFINSMNIISKENILTTGRTYLLQDNKSKELTIVRFCEAYYHDESVHLIVQDIMDNNCLKSIKCAVPSNKNECTWKIIDVNYLIETLSNTNRLKFDKVLHVNIDSDFMEFDF